MPVVPMFPLGTVLLPSMVLPLHIFEERYRALATHCIDDDVAFGVVLIERGSEVGGGDIRTTVGTLARIVESVQFDDGRFALASVGTERVQVQQWLDDDPYPRAEVVTWPDPAPPPDLAERTEPVVRRLRALLAHLAEYGASVAPATTELSTDAVLATYQAVAMAPIGPADKQSLLAAVSAEARIAALSELVDEQFDAVQRLHTLDDEDDEARERDEGDEPEWP